MMQVVQEDYPDHTDKTEKFGMVDVATLMPTGSPGPLAQIKADPRLSDVVLIQQSRLSVLPISATYWRVLCKIAKHNPNQ